MKAFSFFLVLFIIFIIALVIMNSGVLRFFNINPNLIFSLIFAFIALRVQYAVVASLLLLLFCLSLAFYPFWIVEFSLLCFIGFLSLFIRSKLTGNSLSDALIISSFGSLFFSLCLWFFSHSSIDIYQIVLQIIYNDICVLIFVLVMQPLIRRGGILKV